MTTVSLPRRIERVRHELRRRELVVRRVERISPGMVALVFGGEALEGFTSLSFDDHVKLIVDDGPAPFRRDYTPRRHDAARGELTIEFALHGHGPASEWARGALPGTRAVIGGPRGSMIVPVDHDWHLLAGDTSALPAIRRRLEELPAGARTIVLAEVPDVADRVLPESADARQLLWADDEAGFLAALDALALPAGDGFAWAAGEAHTMARVRDLLVQRKSHPLAAARVSAYWRRGEAAHHENLAA